MPITTFLSTSTSNGKELVLQPKDRVAEWIRKQDPSICYLQETHFRLKDTHRLKGRGWKKILP